jgi:hypothetical protein
MCLSNKSTGGSPADLWAVSSSESESELEFLMTLLLVVFFIINFFRLPEIALRTLFSGVGELSGLN